MGELAKLQSWKKDLAKAETFDEMKLLSDGTEAYQLLMKKQGVVKEKIDEIGEFNIEISEAMAGFLDEFFPQGGDRGNQYTGGKVTDCLLYTSPSPRDRQRSRMPSSA